jgi:hypothetical protein
VAYALDVYLGEIERCRQDMTAHCERFAGPYESEAEALDVARRCLREAATMAEQEDGDAPVANGCVD